jgi:hypothetical protein
MKERGVYAHQRSGSTLFYEIIADFMPKRALGEVFTPHEYQSLGKGPDGSLVVRAHPAKDPPQLRDERAELLSESPFDYFIKVFGTDLKEKQCFDAVKDYEFFAIERLNAFEAVLSGIIALNFWYFHKSDGDPHWDHFTAKKEQFTFMRDAMLSYYIFKRHLKIIKTVIYEDIDDFCQTYGDVCQLANLPNTQKRMLPDSKLLSLERKAEYIQNLDDVVFWYASELDPLLPKDRQGGHLDL